MGRGRESKEWRSTKPGQQWREQESEHWQYWPGTWQLSPSAKAKAQAHGRTTRYDQLDVDAGGTSRPGSSGALAPWRVAGSRPEAAATHAESMMQAVQKALTQTRKADARIRRLQEERVRKDKCWEAFKLKQKKEFAEQKKMYEDDLAKIDKDLEDTATYGGQAATRVQELILKGTAALAPAPRDEAVDMEWEQLVSAPEEMEAGFYSEALRVTRGLANGGARGPPPGLGSMDAAALRTPTRHGHMPPRSPGPGQDGMVSVSENILGGGAPPSAARADPYPSPAASSAPPTPVVTSALSRMSMGEEPPAMVPKTAIHTCQRDSSQPRVPTHVAPPRADVKQGSKPSAPISETGSKGLGGKLEEARRAMMPFGVPLKANPTAPNGPQSFSIQDDDPDLVESTAGEPGVSSGHMS